MSGEEGAAAGPLPPAFGLLKRTKPTSTLDFDPSRRA